MAHRYTAPPFLSYWMVLVALACSPTAHAQNATAEQRWATYNGGLGADAVRSVAVDGFGHVYIAGRATEGLLLGNDTSGNSGTTHQVTFGGGTSDAFLAKIAPQGSMLWCTYFGGAGDDEAIEVVIVGTDSVYLVGNTTSAEGITSDTTAYQSTPGGAGDVFVALFHDNGVLRSATYFGSAENEVARGAAADALGRLVVGGTTDGPGSLAIGVVATQPYSLGNDGLLLLFAGTDSLVAGTFIGGEGDDEVVRVASGGTGIVIVGNTNSTTNIATNGAATPDPQGGQDAFIMRVDTALAIVAGTYHGGNGDDVAYDVAVRNGIAAICGATWSDQLVPDTNAYQLFNAGGGDGFITVFDSTFAPTWSTLFGDTVFDAFTSITSDISGRWYIAGSTRSGGLASEISGQGSQRIGPSDMFLLRFDSAQAIGWARYFGGSGEEEATSLAVMGSTSIYVGGITDSDSLFANTGHQMQLGGGQDGGTARLDQKESTPPVGISNCPGGGSGGGGGGGGSTASPPTDQIHVCLGNSITLLPYGGALGYSATWMWYQDECGIPEHFLISGDTITLWPTISFRLWVRAESAFHTSSCRFVDIVVHTPPVVTTSVTDTMCAGGDIEVLGFGAPEFSWTVADSVYIGTNNTFNAPLAAGPYTVQIAATEGVCTVLLTDSITVLPLPAAVWSIEEISCYGSQDGALSLPDADSLALEVIWNTAGLVGPNAAGLGPGTYLATVTDNMGCQRTDTLLIHAPVALVDSIATTAAHCARPTGAAQAFGGVDPGTLTYQWSSTTASTDLVQGLLPGSHLLTVSDGSCTEEHPFFIPDSGSIQAIISADTLIIEDGPVLLLCSVAPPDGAATILWQPELWIEDPTAFSTWCEPTDTIVYTATVTSALGCIGIDSVVVLPKTTLWSNAGPPCGEAFLPTLFSPNGDGLNDALCLLGGCVTGLDMHVYDRWGQVVFHSTTVDACWDGTANGAMLPTGPYVCTLIAERSTGGPFEWSGTILLKR